MRDSPYIYMKYSMVSNVYGRGTLNNTLKLLASLELKGGAASLLRHHIKKVNSEQSGGYLDK